MKLERNKPDQRTSVTFSINGHKCRLVFDRWDIDDDMVRGTITSERTKYNAGGVLIFSKGQAALENDENDGKLVSCGTSKPRVKTGDCGDLGDQLVGDDEDIAALIAAVGLNPADYTHHGEVTLLIRAASLTLARKIASLAGISRRERDVKAGKNR